MVCPSGNCTTVFTDGSLDICNQLEVTLMGGGDAAIPDGINTDGYQASYTYEITKEMPANDLHMSCFGFDADPVGYFCVGVAAQELYPNQYNAHGAGYWLMTAAEIEAKNARSGEVAEEQVEEGVDEEDVEYYDD